MLIDRSLIRAHYALEVKDAVLTPTPAALLTVLERIETAVRPTRILAFGSRVRGDHQPESDLDLLVILPKGSSPAEVTAQLYEAVGAVGFSKDILVSEEGALESAASPNSVAVEALRTGLTLHTDGRTDRAALEKICR